MLVRARPLLGTLVEIKVQADSPAQEGAAANAAFEAIARVHTLMSFHERDSDVSRLNRRAHVEPVAVDLQTYEVLSRALQFSTWSGGLFDCTVGASLVEMEFLPVVDATVEAGAGSFRDIELLGDSRVRFKRPLCIDVGGIAKGYAVDRAVSTLKACGARAGIVNAGGDLRGFGDRDWPISVRHPLAPQQLIRLPALRNASFATTADYFVAREHGGRTVNPIVDPRTRQNRPDVVSVSVTAPCCMDADALTKIIWLGSEPPRTLLERLGARAIVMGPASRSPPAHQPPTVIGVNSS